METKTESETSGSTEYLANHKIDAIIKKGKEELKHQIHLSVEKLTKTKKRIVKEMAEAMEKEGYPVNQISDRLTKSLKGLVAHNTITEALGPKYKDPVKSAQALAQNVDSVKDRRDREELLKKPYKEVDGNDILKGVLPKATLEKVVAYQMGQVEFWKRQLEQLCNLALDQEKSDAEIGKAFREAAKKFMEGREGEKPVPKARKRGQPKNQKMGKAKEKMALLADAMAARAEGRI